MTRVFLFFIFILSAPSSLFSQDDKIATLIKEGISLHDKGKYNAAINTYKKILQIDKKHALTHYEISLSYYELRAYKKAIKSANKTLKYGKDKRVILSAYLIKGAAIDDSGNPKKAIKMYKKAIKIYPNNHLLHSNLGYDYYKLNDFDKAESAIKRALELNPEHNISNLLLADVNAKKGLRIQALMAISKFLFLENLNHPVNITPRSKQAFQLYKSLVLGNIQANSSNQININLMMHEGDEFSTLNLLIPMMQAANQNVADSLELSEIEQLDFSMKMLCQIISKSSEKTNTFWNKQFIQFYQSIQEKELVKAFSHMILLSTKDKHVISWINQNADQIEKLEKLEKTFRDHHQLE